MALTGPLKLSITFNNGITDQENFAYKIVNKLAIFHFVINVPAGIASGTRADIGKITDSNFYPKKYYGMNFLAVVGQTVIGQGVDVPAACLMISDAGYMYLDNNSGKTIKQFRGTAIYITD